MDSTGDCRIQHPGAELIFAAIVEGYAYRYNRTNLITRHRVPGIAMELLFSGIISWCQGGVGVEVLAFDGCFEIFAFKMKTKHSTLMKAKKIPFMKAKYCLR